MRYRKSSSYTIASNSSRNSRKRRKNEATKDLQIIENILSNAERFIRLHISGISFMEEEEIQSYLVQLHSLCNLNPNESNRKSAIKYKLNRILQEYTQTAMEVNQETSNTSFDVNLLTNNNFLSNSNSSDSGITPDIIPETQKSISFNYETRGMVRRISFNEFSRKSKLTKKRSLLQSNKTNSETSISETILPKISCQLKSCNKESQERDFSENTQKIQKTVTGFVTENNHYACHEIINLVEEEETPSDAETILFDIDNMELNTNKMVSLAINNSERNSPKHCRYNSKTTKGIIKKTQVSSKDSTKMVNINKIINTPSISDVKNVINPTAGNHKWLHSNCQNINFGKQYHNRLTNVSSCVLNSSTNITESSEDFSNTIAETCNNSNISAISPTEIYRPVSLQYQTYINKDSILFRKLSDNNFKPVQNAIICTNLQDEYSRQNDNSKTRFVHSENQQKSNDYFVAQYCYSTNDAVCSQDIANTIAPTINSVETELKSNTLLPDYFANGNSETNLCNELSNNNEIQTQDFEINAISSQTLMACEPEISKYVQENPKIANIISQPQISSCDSLSHQNVSNKTDSLYSSIDDNIIQQTKTYSVFPQQSENVNNFSCSESQYSFENTRHYSKSPLKKPRIFNSINTDSNYKTTYRDRSSIYNKYKVHVPMPIKKKVILETNIDDHLPEDVYFSQSSNISLNTNFVVNTAGFDFTQRKPSQHYRDDASSNITNNNIQINREIGGIETPLVELGVSTIEGNVNNFSLQNVQTSEKVNPDKKILESIADVRNICTQFKLNFIADIKEFAKIKRAKMQAYVKSDLQKYNPFLYKVNVEKAVETMDVENKDEKRPTVDNIEGMTELFTNMLHKELKLAALTNNKLHMRDIVL